MILQLADARSESFSLSKCQYIPYACLSVLCIPQLQYAKIMHHCCPFNVCTAMEEEESDDAHFPCAVESIDNLRWKESGIGFVLKRHRMVQHNNHVRVPLTSISTCMDMKRSTHDLSRYGPYIGDHLCVF